MKHQKQEFVHRAVAGSFFKAEEQACKISVTSATTCTQFSDWILLPGWRTSLRDPWNFGNNFYAVLLLDPSSRLKNKPARSLKHQQEELVYCALAGSFFKAVEQVCKISEISASTCTQVSCWILLQGWRTSLHDFWNISNNNLYTMLLLDPSSRLKNKSARISNKSLYTVLFLDPSSRLKNKSARSLKHQQQQQQLVHCALAGSFFKAEEQVCKISETSSTRACTLSSCWILLQGWRTSLHGLWNINNNLYTMLLLDPSSNL